MLPGKIKTKLKGHALAITLVIGIVLTVLMTSTILIRYYHDQYAIAFDVERELDHHLTSGVNYVLTDTSLNVKPSILTLPLSDQEAIPVTINRYLWGLFEVANIKAQKGRWQKEQNFFTGTSLPSYMEGSLYLVDHQRPLSLAGNTRLIGDAYLPGAGLKPGSIEGKVYNSKQLLEGSVKKSNMELPSLPVIMPSFIDNIAQGENTYTHHPRIEDGHLANSFSKPEVIFKEHGPVFLKNLSLKGHILIQSDTYIEVEKNAKLENVILIAPVIRLKQQFEGSLQAIAKDSLLVEDECKLNYPSALVLEAKQSGAKQPVLKLGPSCSISGLILSFSLTSDVMKTLVIVDQNAFIQGVLFARGYVTIKGKLSGCVITDYFKYETRSGEYENYLVDAEINRRSLPDYFLVPGFFQPDHMKSIIQWVE